MEKSSEMLGEFPGKIIGPFAQKDRFVRLVESTGGDRPAAAYDELKGRVGKPLNDILGGEDDEQVLAQLQESMVRHEVIRTHKHEEAEAARG